MKKSGGGGASMGVIQTALTALQGVITTAITTSQGVITTAITASQNALAALLVATAVTTGNQLQVAGTSGVFSAYENIVASLASRARHITISGTIVNGEDATALVVIEIATGTAGNEVVVGTWHGTLPKSSLGAIMAFNINLPMTIASGTRISIHSKTSSTTVSPATGVRFGYNIVRD